MLDAEVGIAAETGRPEAEPDRSSGRTVAVAQRHGGDRHEHGRRGSGGYRRHPGSDAPGGRALMEPERRSRLVRRRAEQLRVLANLERERSAGAAATEVPVQQRRLVGRQLVVELQRETLTRVFATSPHTSFDADMQLRVSEVPQSSLIRGSRKA